MTWTRSVKMYNIHQYMKEYIKRVEDMKDSYAEEYSSWLVKLLSWFLDQIQIRWGEDQESLIGNQKGKGCQ